MSNATVIVPYLYKISTHSHTLCFLLKESNLVYGCDWGIQQKIAERPKIGAARLRRDEPEVVGDW